MPKQEWIYQPVPAEQRKCLQEALGVGEVCAELLCRRGYTEIDQAADFLKPRLAHLEDPFAVTHVEAVADRLVEAIRKGHKVAVLGDYDVDGVTSTVLMVDILRRFGLKPTYFVPRRLQEGYGMTTQALEQLLDQGRPELLIALDCGTNSLEEVRWLKARGIDVLIVDHHQSKGETLPDCLIVNPHVHDTPDAPWAALCTVGLVFKVAHGLVKRLREQDDPVAQRIKLREYLDLVAMGTVADLMPLTRENRILTCHGLRHLSNSNRLGVSALFDVAGLHLGQDLQPSDIAFKLGPRINASGRLADALLPVEMLLSKDHQECGQAARRLEAYNRERQAIERAMVDEACACVEDGSVLEGIVVAGHDWHPGVVGIVAGKLARQFQRPCIALGRDGDQWVGSGRSYGSVNLQEVLQRCDGFLSEWGGHPKAVGISLPQENLEAFREAFHQSVKDILIHEAEAEDVLELAAWLPPQSLTESFLEQLELLQPFGEGNPEPVLGVKGVRLQESPILFGECHYRFRLPVSAETCCQGIAWRKADAVPPVARPIDMAVKFRRHYWNGHCFPQVELIDWRPADPQG